MGSSSFLRVRVTCYKRRPTAFDDCLADLAHKSGVKGEIMKGSESRTERLTDLEEVADVGGAVTLGRREDGPFVERTVVFSPLRARRINTSVQGVERVVPRHTGGQDAVEHVDAAGDGMEDVAGMADSLLLDRKAMREIELATTGHAWWETVALTLKRRSDQAGGWVTPADLSGLLKDEPDLLAALSGPSGATVPRASAIVSHWMTETVARTPIPQPRTEEAARALDMFRHRLMECGA